MKISKISNQTSKNINKMENYIKMENKNSKNRKENNVTEIVKNQEGAIVKIMMIYKQKKMNVVKIIVKTIAIILNQNNKKHN